MTEYTPGEPDAWTWPDAYETDEPIGSCEWCGVNLYPEDDLDLCSGCLWSARQNRGDEGSGMQPVT